MNRLKKIYFQGDTMIVITIEMGIHILYFVF